MAESDDDYVQAVSGDEVRAPQANGHGTRGRNSEGRSQAGGTRERWEDVQRSWDQVKEGADGSLAGAVEGLLEAGKRKRLLKDTTPIQRGIIRHVTLIIDLSTNMTEKDYRPTRALMALRTAADFIRTFFEQNPISQLCILTTHSGLSQRQTSMSGNPTEHITALTKLQEEHTPTGSPSLQNSLELARASLAAAPSHGTKEIILLYGALNTADPGDINATIRALVTDRIRVSVVALAARLAILTTLVVKTNGLPGPSATAASSDELYGVAMHESHFRALLMGHTTPPATTAAEQARRAPSLLPMGFPSRMEEAHASFCVCHHRPGRGGYLCTRCNAKVCGLPVGCPTCGLQLVQSTHLARSYHHLFPLRNYREVGWVEVRERRRREKEVGRREEEEEELEEDEGIEEVVDQCFGCLAPFPSPPPRLSHDHNDDAADDENTAHDPSNADGMTEHTRKDKGKGKARRASDSNSPVKTKNKPNSQTRPTSTETHNKNKNTPNNQTKPTSQTKATGESKTAAGASGASESSRYACTSCGEWFCIECDILAHEVLHNCSGCLCGGGGGGGGEGEGDGQEGGDRGGDVEMDGT